MKSESCFSSCKRKDKMREIKQDIIEKGIRNGEIKTGKGLNHESSLPRPGSTRWGSHYKMLLRLVEMFSSLQEYNGHFNEANSELLVCTSTLSHTASFCEFDKEKLLRLDKFYPEDFSVVECISLKQQLDIYIDSVRGYERFANLKHLGDLSWLMVETKKLLSQTLVYRLLKLSLILHVATATVERCFSGIKTVKTVLRNRICDHISASRKLLFLGIRQKIHSGYEVRVWEDPWIPTRPARPAIPVAPVMNPNMRVSDLINQDSKEWEEGTLENYVHPGDIPLIRSMAISSTHRQDSFCWEYTRNGQYTVKSGYWVAQNLLKLDEETLILEPSITILQAFAWKLKAPRKICHLIWQVITGQVAVTRNLVRRNMRCDNYCPRCGEAEESVTHAIFECPPALQAWSLSTTPTSPGIFPASSVYTNMDYLFWRKKNIIASKTGILIPG
ncbi:PREDICTED: uncharacterized protein LOC106315002 [Brassica oleracea var. oleracea]|uniref:uncharacterized protein LOC106315002 n=1 Tax=Brassica oleracea var. oleracea TaxID=109376 RepID=UPI0006A6EC66|nr:PREDICTED: uncharacterized protein LOC106315002 [Brassica oleracea var. oleracea]